MSQVKRALLALAVFLAAATAVWPTVAGVFLYDDSGLMQEHALPKDGRSLGTFLGHDAVYGLESERLFRPVFMLSVLIQRIWLGESAVPFHFINVILHGLVAVLLFYLATEFWGLSLSALTAASLFAVHPVHVDAVAFVKNRSELLSALFVLWGALALLRDPGWREFLLPNRHGPPSMRPRAPLGPAFLFFLALLSKESAAGILGVLALSPLLLWLRAVPPPTRSLVWKLLVPFGAVFGVYLLMRIAVLGRMGHVEDALFPADTPIFQRIAAMSRIFLDYLGLLFFPRGLRIDYMDLRPDLLKAGFPAVVSLLVHAGLWLIALVSVRRSTTLSFFILAFYLLLLPVSHVVSFGDVMAERFLYVPSIPFCLAVGWGLGGLARITRREGLCRILSAFMVVGCATAAHRYSGLFESGSSLWSAMAERRPLNPKFRLNQGLVLMGQRRWEESVRHLQAAHDLDPTTTSTYLPLAQGRLRMGENRKAEEILSEAVRRGPEYAETHRNYAAFHYDFGDLAVAEEQIGIARRLDPADPGLKTLERMIRDRLRGQSFPPFKNPSRAF